MEDNIELKEIKYEIIKCLYNNDGKRIYYYDKEIENFGYILIKDYEEFVANFDLDDSNVSEEEEVMLHLLYSTNRVIPLFEIKKNELKKLSLEFIEKVNNEELNLIKDSKRFNSMFKKTINKLNLNEEWLDFLLNSLNDQVEFFIDATGIKEIPTSQEMYKEIIEKCNKIYELKPWEVLTDCDIIEFQNPVENIYYCILGNAGQTFGLSIYDKEDLDGLKTILYSDSLNVDNLLCMTLQKNYIVYFEKVDKYSNEYHFLKELGIEKNAKILPSLVRYDTGLIKTNSLSLKEAKEMNAKLGYFLDFYYEYIDNPDYFDSDLGFYLSFRYSNGIKISSKRNILGLLMNCMFDFSDLPHLEGVKFNNGVDEIDIRCLGLYNHDAGEKICSASYIVMIVDASSGFIKSGILIDGSNQNFLADVYNELQKYVDNNSIARNVIVSNSFVEQILDVLFEHRLKIKRGKLKKTDKAFNELQKYQEDRLYN